METQEGACWQWTLCNWASAPHALPGSLEVSQRKLIKSSGELLGSVVYEVLDHRWAQPGLECVGHIARKTFSVPDSGKLTGSGMYKPAQAHIYGGRQCGTMLTRPTTMRRYPLEANAVAEGAEAPEGLLRATAAALLVLASSQEVQVVPPRPLWFAPRFPNLKVECR